MSTFYFNFMQLLVELWLWKPFQQCTTYVMNICAKFHPNLSTEYGDTASREIGVNGQRTDGQPENILLSAYYCQRRHKWHLYRVCVSRIMIFAINRARKRCRFRFIVASRLSVYDVWPTATVRFVIVHVVHMLLYLVVRGSYRTIPTSSLLTWLGAASDWHVFTTSYLRQNNHKAHRTTHRLAPMDHQRRPSRRPILWSFLCESFIFHCRRPPSVQRSP